MFKLVELGCKLWFDDYKLEKIVDFRFLENTFSQKMDAEISGSVRHACGRSSEEIYEK